MWATGTGADVMKRIAAPQVGGVFSAMILTLLVIPPVYVLWRWHAEVKRVSTPPKAKAHMPVGKDDQVPA
jgi:Cu(I)/Ag(I) efflux system membrane protein CusA/SilA